MYLDTQNTFSKVPHQTSLPALLHNMLIPMVSNKAEDRERTVVVEAEVCSIVKASTHCRVQERSHSWMIE